MITQTGHKRMNRHQTVRTRTRDIDFGSLSVTENKLHEHTLEDRLPELQDQLDKLKAQVRQAQQLAQLGTVAATIAHEVNNLLTPIRSYAQAALDSEDPTLREKALVVTLKNVDMLVSMTGRVLEISAAKTRARRAVAVRTLAEDAVASLCRDLSKDGIRFHVDVEESLNAFVDPLQLQQVLFNLFLNARNAMAPSHEGRLTVAGRRKGDRVILDVSDTGPGIAPEIIEYIFDPLETTKDADQDGKQRCAGLGLALCRDLIEENGGSITAASRLGEGTTFTLDLPVN